MSTIDRPGARVYYEATGEGPPVLLGHSLLCDNRMWGDVATALAARHRVIAVEARGHGRSTGNSSFSLEDLADDWLAILDAEGIDRAVLCGLSMGGMTAMRLALRAPERVAGLALLDTSADPEPRWTRLRYRALGEITRRSGFLRAFLPTARRAFLGRVTRRERPDLVARLDGWLLAMPRETYHASRAVFDRAPLRSRLSAIACPTLVLVGQEDAATPPKRSAHIAQAIRGAQLVTVPRAGHLTTIEAPDAVTHALSRFLGGLLADGASWR